MKKINLKLFILTVILILFVIGGGVFENRLSKKKFLEIQSEVTKYNNLITTIQSQEDKKSNEVKDYMKYLDVYPIDEMNEYHLTEFFDVIEIKNNMQISKKKVEKLEDYYRVTCSYSVYYKDLEKYYELVDKVLEEDKCVENESISVKSTIKKEHEKDVKYYDIDIVYKVYYFNTNPSQN